MDLLIFWRAAGPRTSALLVLARCDAMMHVQLAATRAAARAARRFPIDADAPVAHSGVDVGLPGWPTSRAGTPEHPTLVRR